MSFLLYAGMLAGRDSGDAESRFQTAQPGYRYAFPRDHFSHPSFATEWWYFTGNLQTQAGRKFGFELTFFRQTAHTDAQDALLTNSIWKPDQIYLAHLAFTDIEAHRFVHTQRLSRAGPGLAGASQHDSRYWNGNWAVRWVDGGMTNRMHLQAVMEGLLLELDLDALKPVVVQGRNGVSIKGPLDGEASHYLSFTRLHTAGFVRLNNRQFLVAGLSWMDHEFFTEPEDNALAGWDWFSVQLDDGADIMIYRLRDRQGQASRYSSGTYVDSLGRATTLDAPQFTLHPGQKWEAYPIEWQIDIPSLQIELQARPEVNNQELGGNPVSPPYWEGSVRFVGHHGQAGVSGRGYLEMTGYRKPVHLGTK